MGSRFFAVTFFFILCSLRLSAQQAAIYGKVKTQDGKGIDGAGISVEGENIGGISDASGKYRIEVPANKSLTLVFTYLSAIPKRFNVTLKPGEKYHYDVAMDVKAISLVGHTVHDTRAVENAGTIHLDVTDASHFASTVDPISGLIKTLVGQNNELTSQYAVRGGNYDENLVYVNDFEIYRPFLVRSGQQEGLSFVNSDLVKDVSFSLGGFQAKYGDKMSSVLDVTYRRPTHFAGTVTASLLGASLSLEGATKNQKLTYLIGLRQKSNQYLLAAQPTKGVYNPSFTDAQALVNYRFNDKWEVEAIANYSRNRFTFYPTEAVANFGELTQAYQVHLFYTGGEIDQFDSRFGGLSTTYTSTKDNHRLKLKMLVSGFQTNESETYDISGEYLFGELETDLGKTNFGQIKDYLGTGVIQNYARNYLKVNVATISHRGWYATKKHAISWGLDASYNSINDRLHEWERRDSGGFSQPYNPSALQVMTYYDGSSDFNYMRYYGFLQDNFALDSAHRATVSAGVRYSYSMLNKEFIVSPRVQFNYKLSHKLFFKAAAGMYAQPPFYREMRDMDGNLNKDLLAQKSTHFLAGIDYTDSLNGRPYKLTGEVYYKHMWDLVPYVYDNVRIRYYGRNDAVGYAAGGEVRLYGDIVKDATSWISLGIMKTSENLLDDSIVYHNTAGADSAITHPGYIPRPSDQRLNIGMYFQDYLPHNKNFQVHLSLQYATGLPYGAPDKPRAADTLRLPAYKRVDIGFSALLLDGKKKNRPAHSFFNNLGSIWASLEVFNLLGIQNTLSYTWIQDQSSGKTFAVPNRLTSRLLNVKIIVKF